MRLSLPAVTVALCRVAAAPPPAKSTPAQRYEALVRDYRAAIKTSTNARRAARTEEAPARLASEERATKLTFAKRAALPLTRRAYQSHFPHGSRILERLREAAQELID
jgi:hypothetical protein